MKPLLSPSHKNLHDLHTDGRRATNEGRQGVGSGCQHSPTPRSLRVYSGFHHQGLLRRPHSNRGRRASR